LDALADEHGQVDYDPVREVGVDAPVDAVGRIDADDAIAGTAAPTATVLATPSVTQVNGASIARLSVRHVCE
jgi:hypothetical protein